MAKLRARDCTTLDFESFKIEDGRHRYPPKPVGLSIRFKGETKAKYHAFGHPEENNCDKSDVRKLLERAWADARKGVPIICQNTKFDYDIATTHFGLPDLPWEMLHDTLYLLFLDNPHASSHKLKPSGERLLGIKPDEQDAVREWLEEHQDWLKSKGILDKKKRIGKKNAGEFIAYAPGKLVGEYANQDVNLTDKLFDLLYTDVCVEREMTEAYERERELMPILLENERQGIRFDLERGEPELEKLFKAQAAVDQWLLKKLKTDINLDSDDELAAALIRAGLADEDLFKRNKPTKKQPDGALSVSKASLEAAITDKQTLHTLQYRSKLNTFVGTFLEPWVIEAQHCKGRVHPNWNQVKMYGAFGDAGARTGRMSASRFMNTPKEAKKTQLPTWIKAAAPLPMVRSFLLPDKGHLWGKRDYSQQEFRVLAHYEDGALLAEFQKNPKLDVHILVASLLNDVDADELAAAVEAEDPESVAMRSTAKNNGFGLLYGMGIAMLADRLGVDVAKAKELKKEYLKVLPGISDVMKRLKDRAKRKMPFYTWGGREYYCEEPTVKKLPNGHLKTQTYEYKMINYLIQGSSADCTKQAILNYHHALADAKTSARFLITVHDEINFTAPEKQMGKEMKRLADAMADVDFQVPMLSDGSTGPNWGTLKKVG